MSNTFKLFLLCQIRRSGYQTWSQYAITYALYRVLTNLGQMSCRGNYRQLKHSPFFSIAVFWKLSHFDKSVEHIDRSCKSNAERILVRVGLSLAHTYMCIRLSTHARNVCWRQGQACSRLDLLDLSISQFNVSVLVYTA